MISSSLVHRGVANLQISYLQKEIDHTQTTFLNNDHKLQKYLTIPTYFFKEQKMNK
jgi:hypothetical protein